MSYSVQVVVIGDDEGEVRTWLLDNHDALHDALDDADQVAAAHFERTGIEPTLLDDGLGGPHHPFEDG